MAVLVGRKAPHFKANAIVDGGKEKSDFSFLTKPNIPHIFHLHLLNEIIP